MDYIIEDTLSTCIALTKQLEQQVISHLEDISQVISGNIYVEYEKTMRQTIDQVKDLRNDLSKLHNRNSVM